jgi:tRNA (adenine22-N1)-methyltransferase
VTDASTPSDLSPRLRAVAEMVPGGSRVADIGTDHGVLPRRLVESDRASHCVATELCARRLAPDALEPGSSAVEVRVGDGLGPLGPEDRLDVLVLAGLGARTMLRILDDPRLERLAVRRLVLQPQSETARLRRWLIDRGFRIVDERLILDRGHYYVVLAAEPDPGGEPPRHPGLDLEQLLEAGPCLVASDDPLVARYWSDELARQERILRVAPEGAARSRALRRRDTARGVLRAVATGSGI